MVWALTPVQTVLGMQKHYIFTAGTYKVGRKDCDMIVKMDPTISQVHAEISIDKMVAWDPLLGAPATPSCVCVVDRSKYGTFVNKVHGTQGSRLRKDEGAMLNDGDIVTFGAHGEFRLSFVPIVVLFQGRKSARIDPSLQAIMKSIGAYATCKWSDECTHVLVDDSCSLTPELLDAVIAKKQIVLGDWFKAMAEKNMHTEIPSCTQYIPNLTLDGTTIKMVDVNLIQNCLADYTFILGSSDKYKFGEKLHALLELAGAKYLHIDEYCANSQDSESGDTDQQILVVPARYPLEFSKIRLLFPLSKLSDVKLFAAVLSGRLEAAAIEPPAFIITSSNSTDETIVADSDVEMETATSAPTVAASKSQNIEHNSYDKEEITNSSDKDAVDTRGTKANVCQKDLEQVEVSKPVEDDVRVIEQPVTHRFQARDENIRTINKLPKDENVDISRDGTSDVIFSQDLLVKSFPLSAPATSTQTGGVNFKHFRKRETMRGNSFRDVVPFAREPYRESDYDSSTTDFVREERQRKQMEAIADGLFNNAKFTCMEPEPEPVSGDQVTGSSGGEAAPRLPPAPKEQMVAAGAEDEEEAFEDALTDEQLREKAKRQANDAKAEGNKLFGAGQYEEALAQYEMALQIAAELESAEDICSACHSNRAVCFLKLGKYDDTIKECTKALELNPSYLKALLRRAEAHEKLEHYDEAIADMKKILETDPSNQQAKRSMIRLEPLAAEKREKMKEEMIGKLKELGNSVLGRFGMSVDNFKAVKDPNTGSYSISFQK